MQASFFFVEIPYRAGWSMNSLLLWNNNNLKSRLSLIVQVNVVLNRTVVVNSD